MGDLLENLVWAAAGGVAVFLFLNRHRAAAPTAARAIAAGVDVGLSDSPEFDGAASGAVGLPDKPRDAGGLALPTSRLVSAPLAQTRLTFGATSGGCGCGGGCGGCGGAA
jgi:hypothetical protein